MRDTTDIFVAPADALFPWAASAPACAQSIWAGVRARVGQGDWSGTYSGREIYGRDMGKHRCLKERKFVKCRKGSAW